MKLCRPADSAGTLKVAVADVPDTGRRWSSTEPSNSDSDPPSANGMVVSADPAATRGVVVMVKETGVPNVEPVRGFAVRMVSVICLLITSGCGSVVMPG